MTTTNTAIQMGNQELTCQRKARLDEIEAEIKRHESVIYELLLEVNKLELWRGRYADFNRCMTERYGYSSAKYGKMCVNGFKAVRESEEVG